MGRITTATDNGENAIVLDGGIQGYLRIDINKYNYVIRGLVADRLAAYEDTGLSPEEITALIADNKRLHRLIDDIEETLGKDGKSDGCDD